MGVVNTINPPRGRFPRQSDLVGARTQVCFHYESAVLIGGTIVRDDMEEPWRVIIQLDDGPLVLSTECQYTPPVRPSGEVPR